MLISMAAPPQAASPLAALSTFWGSSAQTASDPRASTRVLLLLMSAASRLSTQVLSFCCQLCSLSCLLFYELLSVRRGLTWPSSKVPSSLCLADMPWQIWSFLCFFEPPSAGSHLKQCFCWPMLLPGECELHALFVDLDCIRLLLVDLGVLFYPNPGCLRKILSDFHLTPSIKLQKFLTLKDQQEILLSNSTICPGFGGVQLVHMGAPSGWPPFCPL